MENATVFLIIYFFLRVFSTCSLSVSPASITKYFVFSSNAVVDTKTDQPNQADPEITNSKKYIKNFFIIQDKTKNPVHKFIGNRAFKFN
jgi:hypothetical protein